MSENCTHDCSSCQENCSERSGIKKESQNELSDIKKIIGIVSGKGGVGKSFVCSSLAAIMQKQGSNAAIIDADITGPSIPKTFGIKEKAQAINEKYLLPVKSKSGVKIMSINLLLEDEKEPVVWRGPVIAGAVKQFYTDVCWDKVEYMFIDMPPGTGDVPLTVFQSIPVDGIIVVTSPQELVSVIVAKAVKMAKLMNVPILGIVENYSYYSCPECGKKTKIFGESNIKATAESLNIKAVAQLPINPQFAAMCDNGEIENIDPSYFENIICAIKALN